MLNMQLGGDVNSADDNGSTALYVATERGEVAVVELLLKHGADVNAATKNTGDTVLIVACKNLEDEDGAISIVD